MPSILFYDIPMKECKELWPGGLRYAGDPVGTDSLALADFTARSEPGRGVDLGCGSGILLLLLSSARPETEMVGVEIRPGAAEECRANIRANRMESRCSVITGDYRTAALPRGEADLVVTNPPYFPAGRGGISPDRERALMRTESATIAELCAAASSLLRPGGAFCLVHRTERMAELFSALTGAGLEPKRLRLVAPDPKSAPLLFLLEARRGTGPGMAVEPTLFQRGADGRETAEYRRICHWEEAL